MLSHIDPLIPVIVVANFVEAHRDFLSRSVTADGLPSPLSLEAHHEDRTLLWVGDPKLVIVSQPIPHAEFICQQLGYSGTRHLAPHAATECLSQDIMRDERLQRQIVAYAGAVKTVQLVPYAATSEFYDAVEYLRTYCGLTVLLPECPAPEALWLRDYIDTKSGFHHLAGRWLPNSGDLLPEGYVCRDSKQAAAVASWFHAVDRTCIAKPDAGESGLGTQILEPSRDIGPQQIEKILRHRPYWADEPILVEEFVAAEVQSLEPVSPSVEIFVPPSDEGDPVVTYVSEQLFQAFGEFSGVLVSRDQLSQPWYDECVSNCLLIARELQQRGYVGHFDVDAVLDGSGQPRLLELNARRTGGTHVHDFAFHAFGPDYLEQVSLLSWESIDCTPLDDWQLLLAKLQRLLFPIDGVARGVVITVSSSVIENQFGVLLVGSDRQDVLNIQRELTEILKE